jgi:hypothetical protein
MSETEEVEVEEVEELQDYSFAVTLSLVSSDGDECEATYDTVISAETGTEAAISFARAFNENTLEKLLQNAPSIEWSPGAPIRSLAEGAFDLPDLQMTGVSVVTDAEKPDDKVKVEDLIG